MSRGVIKSEVAEGVPFEGDNFTSDNVQDAIIEAKENAEGFPRAGLALVYNGTLGDGDLISYSNLTPEVPIVFPVNTKLNELTFANNRNSVECDLLIYDGGVSGGTLIKTVSVSTGAGVNYQSFDLNADNLTFNAGDFIQIEYSDQGTNARDMVVTLWISRIP